MVKFIHSHIHDFYDIYIYLFFSLQSLNLGWVTGLNF